MKNHLYHIFVSSKAEWYEITDDLSQYYGRWYRFITVAAVLVFYFIIYKLKIYTPLLSSSDDGSLWFSSQDLFLCRTACTAMDPDDSSYSEKILLMCCYGHNLASCLGLHPYQYIYSLICFLNALGNSPLSYINMENILQMTLVVHKDFGKQVVEIIDKNEIERLKKVR